MAEQKRFNNAFEFVGELVPPKDKTKLLDVKISESGWENNRLSLAIKESKTNSVFLELQGGKWKDDKKNKVVKTRSKDNGDVEIPWNDRTKISNIDLVADYRKTSVDLETDFERKEQYTKLYFQIRALERREDLSSEDKKKLEDYIIQFDSLSDNRHEFITDYDLVTFLKENIVKFEGKKTKVRGVIEASEWKGKYYFKFKPQSFELVPEETPTGLTAKVDIFYGRDSLDLEFKDSLKKIFLNAYVKGYDRASKEDRFYPKTFVINLDKLDEANELHKSMLQSIFIDNLSVDSDTYLHLVWDINVYRGAEVKEFSEEHLTQKQKEMISFGLAKLEDYKPKGNVLGNNVEEYRLVKPVLTGDFVEGALDTYLNEDEFLELVAKNTADVKLADVKKTEDAKEDEPKKDDGQSNSMTEDLVKNLFG